MQGDLTDIYGGYGGGLIGTAIGYFVGLLIIVGGFIFISRYLIGKRVEHFEREWRASHGSNGADEQKRPPPDERKPPSSW